MDCRPGFADDDKPSQWRLVGTVEDSLHDLPVVVLAATVDRDKRVGKVWIFRAIDSTALVANTIGRTQRKELLSAFEAGSHPCFYFHQSSVKVW